MAPKWLNRELIVAPYYTLCTSQKMLEGELKRLKVPNRFDGVPGSAGACVHHLENVDGKSMSIVCLFDHTYEIEQIHAMLAHEATHIWQRVVDDLRENLPSREFEAYSIQRISQSLFYEYSRQLKKKKVRR